jgi:hypothetical protein
MPVQYNNQALVPAPTATISTNFDRYEDGLYKKSLFTITLKGKLFADRGGVFKNEDGAGANVDYTDGILYGAQNPNEFQNSEQLVSQSNPPSGWSAQDANTGYIKQQALHKKILALYAAIDPARGAGDLIDRVAQPQPSENGRPGFLVITGWSTGLGQENSRIECFARVKSIEIPEGSWNVSVDYTITLESEYIKIYDGLVKHVLGSDDDSVPIDENWSFEPADEDERYFKLSRKLSAQSLGKRSKDNNQIYTSGWVLARNAIAKALSPDNNSTNAVPFFNIVGVGNQPNLNSKFLSSGATSQPTADVFIFPSNSLDFIQGFNAESQFNKFINGSGGFVCYNPKRNITIDKKAGKVTADENWTCASRKSFLDTIGLKNAINAFALEDYDISVSDNSENNNLDISVKGTITGVRFFPTDTVIDKFNNACDVFTNISANNYAAIKARINSYYGASGIYQNSLYPQGLPLTRHTKLEVGKNPAAGTISYSLNYATKDFVDITKLTCSGVTQNTKKAFALVKDHSISVKDNGPSYLSSEMKVFNRGAGPVIYAVGSTSKITRSISISVNFDKLPPVGQSTIGISGLTNGQPNVVYINGPVSLPSTQQIFEAYNCIYGLWDSSALKLKGPLFLDSVESDYDLLTGKWNGSITITSSN